MSIRMESILEARDLGVVLAIITSSLGETAGHSLWLLPRRSVAGTADPGAGRYPTHPRNKGLPSHMTQFSQQLNFFLRHKKYNNFYSEYNHSTTSLRGDSLGCGRHEDDPHREAGKL